MRKKRGKSGEKKRGNVGVLDGVITAGNDEIVEKP